MRRLDAKGYFNSFVQAYFRYDSGVVTIRPLRGHVKEIQVVADLLRQKGGHVIWEPAKDSATRKQVRFFRSSPDALDIKNGILYEVASNQEGRIRKESRLHASKVSQLNWYRMLFWRNRMLDGVELIITGAVDDECIREYMRIMKGVPFVIRVYSYDSLEPVRVMWNEAEAETG